MVFKSILNLLFGKIDILDIPDFLHEIITRGAGMRLHISEYFDPS